MTSLIEEGYISLTLGWEKKRSAAHDGNRLRPHGGVAGACPGKPPVDMSFEKGKDSPGTVTFSHESISGGQQMHVLPCPRSSR